MFFVFRTVKSRPNVQLEYNKCPGIQAARSFIGIDKNVVGMRDYSCWCPACIRAVGRDKGGMNSDLVVKHCSSPASGHDLSEVYTSACTCTRMHVHTHVAVGGALCRVQHRRTSPDTHQHRACRYCTCREGARAWGLRDDSGRTALPIQRPLLWPRSPEILTTGACVFFFISSFVAERRHLC